MAKAHVGNATGKFEWYTPPEIIRMAHTVMGGIDLDPASTYRANEIVKSHKFFQIEDDGAAHWTKWAERGEGIRVWLNPPYDRKLIERFAYKLISEVKSGAVGQAMWLSNNATETMWGQTILHMAKAVCFPSGRIKFLDQNLQAQNTPLQGQMIAYMGEQADLVAFATTFDQLGCVWVRNKL